MNEAEAVRMLSSCRLCPRRCGADRAGGQKGFCGAGANVRIARAALHFWEEPCISGRNGSGTVFFSGCTMKCVYCQNYRISSEGLGYEISISQLAENFLRLRDEGAHNINLVTPTQYVPQIICALDKAKERGLDIPIVYNTGGYESIDTLKLLRGYVDVYMPDIKYFDDKRAVKYSSAPDYSKVVCEAVEEMFRQTGEPMLDDEGIMKKGVIIRHLMLPGGLADTVHIIDYVNSKYGSKVYFSLMSQYTPVRRSESFAELNERIKKKCYEFAVERCEELGMENVYIQEGEAADESFIPEFSGKDEHSL